MLLLSSRSSSVDLSSPAGAGAPSTREGCWLGIDGEGSAPRRRPHGGEELQQRLEARMRRLLPSPLAARRSPPSLPPRLRRETRAALASPLRGAARPGR